MASSSNFSPSQATPIRLRIICERSRRKRSSISAAALDAFDARLGFIAARGVDVSALDFAAGFARNLDYYTGFVFEAQDPARADARPIIGGGRYDRLLKTLGAKEDIPAVGAAIWCDRLAPAVGGG